MKSTGAIILTAALIVSGCAAPTTNNYSGTMEDYARAVTIERDQYKKTTWYKGADVSGSPFKTLFLRAFHIEGQPIGYQIYVMDHYEGGWRFYDQAHDSNGNRLNLTLIDRSVGSCSSYRRTCSHFESVAINIGREYLEQHVNKTLFFKVSGRAGEQIFTLAPQYVSGFLASVPKQ